MLDSARLPRNALPLHYVIHLNLDFEQKSIAGKEIIRGKLVEKSNAIFLNAKCIDINCAKIDFGNGYVIPQSIHYDASSETLKFEFENEFDPCDFNMELEFRGRIVDNGLYGLYVCVDSAGNETYSTHFQTSYARCVFPCWDEPTFKAEFALSVTCPSDFDTSCISNMPLESASRNENRATYCFPKTPVMSTYLVGLAIGKFDVAAAETPQGIPIRLFTPKGKATFGQYGAEIASKVIPFFENFFKTPFMLPKMDLVSISQHSFAAMENWGILMFREANLLCDPEADKSRKNEVVQLIGHELAHQWFGNLVTCEWWSQIWLNEGFAEWTEYIVSAHFFPDRRVWLDFLHAELRDALAVDALSTSHPLEIPLKSAAETAEIFDSITYSKGCSLVRMVYNFIGEDNFRDGLALYLSKFSFKNATTPDLWASFDAVTGLDISKVMQSYVSNSGFPLLKVNVKGLQLTIDVETFSAHGFSSPIAVNREALVSVKFLDATKGKSEVVSAFSSNGKVEFKNVVIKPDRLMVANPGSVWLCRVSYPASMWRQLGIASRNPLGFLSAEEIFSIQSDLMALALAGYESRYSVAMWLSFVTNYVKYKSSYAVWLDICSTLALVGELAQELELTSSFKVFVQQLLKPVFSLISWDAIFGEDPDHAELRALLIKTLGLCDDEAVISGCQSRFSKHIAKEITIPFELRRSIFTVVAYHGAEDQCDQLFQLLSEASTDDVRSSILSAIGCFQDSKTRARVLTWMQQAELPVSIQSIPRLLGSMSSSLDGRQLALEYLLQNWSRFVVLCAGPSGLVFTNIVQSVAGAVTDESVADLLEVQFDNEPLLTAKRGVEQTCDMIRMQSKWAKRDASSLRDFFVQFSKPDQSFEKLFDLYFPPVDN